MIVSPKSVEVLNVLNEVSLKQGGHSSPDDGMCVMEAVAYIAGEPHSDHPACASPVITSLAIALNDAMQSDAEREALKPVAFRIVGTRASGDVEFTRACRVVDWYVREVLPENVQLLIDLGADGMLPKSWTPIWREAVEPLRPWIETLRALPAITDEVSARSARGPVNDFYLAARAALDALAALAARAALDALDALAARAALAALDARIEAFRQKRNASIVALLLELCEIGRETTVA
ncbi:MAG TPA: hypothetical protein VLC46_16555 [Thermoanaerobaculia bacterium]|nr:hypothetical protein [Thermoanaerobaculia bacterium]